ncbi:hypothetical protein ABZ646_41645 [Streptomyces sp. NPDC007162]|uniref:hypothetical protein n=1 Tax=Streptomyces sp. NPDC007162 TaxID=3156917 RepID=UPI0033CA6EEA
MLAKVLATSPSSATFGPTVTFWNTVAKPGTSDLFALRASDVAGNTGGASVYRTPNIIQETSTTHTGTWTHRSGTSYLGGYSYSSSSAGASISWTFTGRSVAWIVSRASTSGQVNIYVDQDLVQLRQPHAEDRRGRHLRPPGRHHRRHRNHRLTGRPHLTPEPSAREALAAVP